MLITLKQALAKAEKGGYAIPAFNINNLEIDQAVMEAARELRSPIILQTSEGAIEYAGMEYLKALVYESAKGKIPVVFHLDHGKNLKLIKKAIDSGYTSVMFDGSLLDFKTNARETKKVVAWAKKRGVSVEAELGAIKGIEDLVSVAERQVFFTDPEEAKKFVDQTGIDALAVSIGTAHGAHKFKGEAVLDILRLKKIHALVKKPIVLHGASGVIRDLIEKGEKYGADFSRALGVPDEEITKAILNGVRKINIDTDLRLAFTVGVRQFLMENPKEFDPRKVLSTAKLLMKEVAMRKMKLFGSAGRA